MILSGKSRSNNIFHRKFDMQIIWFAWLHVCLNLKISETSKKAATCKKKTSSGNWKSEEISDKFLLNSASFRFGQAMGTLFRKGFPLEFAILKYFPFVGLLSRHRVKLRRHEAQNVNNSSPSTTVSLMLKHAYTSS